jgi:hypothetical protein
MHLADANRYSSDVPLDPGYRYVFKVRLETDGGAGPDSNSVQFDYCPMPLQEVHTPMKPFLF